MRSIHVHTDLPAPADRVWDALQQSASFLYVIRGVLGFPAMAGRTDPIRAGERGTGWLLLFHVVPLSRHTIEVIEVDDATRTVRTREHGGVVRRWNHTLHVEPVDEVTCRYSDTVELDAGALTGVVAAAGVAMYRYRQLRWRRLVRRHLLVSGPRYAR